MKLFSVLIISLAVSLLAVKLTRQWAIRLQIGALPTARKIHESFIPVLGGIGIFCGLVGGMVAAELLGVLPAETWGKHLHFWVGLLLITVVGLIDDIRGIHHLQKFAGELIAAILAVAGGCIIEAFFSPTGTALNLGWFSYPFTVLWIMFIINAVNLLDGLDGLASGISLITAMGFLVIAALSNLSYWVVLPIALIGGLLGFLRYNYRPASIFMGDVGSLMLGYILACLSIEVLKVAGSHRVYFLASLVMLGMPVTDTLISFFRRMGRGDHPFKPDREHIHHRLLKLGLSHLDSVWMMYYFTALFVALGILMVTYQEFFGILLFVVALTFSLFWAWRLGYLETRKVISFGVNELETRAAIRPQIHADSVWHKIAILCGDIISINFAMYLTWWFKFQSGMINPLTIKSLQDYFTAPVWLVFTGAWLILFWLNGLYRMTWDVSRYDKILRVSKIISFGIFFILILMNIDLLMNSEAIERTMFNSNQISTLAFYWVIMFVAVNAARMLIIIVEKKYHLFEYSFKNTLVIGTTRQAKNIIRDIEKNPHMLHKIVGVVDRKAKCETFENYPLLGGYDDLPKLIYEHKIEEIIIAIRDTAREDLLNIIGVCDRLQVVIKTLPSLQSIFAGKSPELAGYSLVRAFPEKMMLWQWGIKRLIDISFAVICLLFTLPFWLTLALIVRYNFRESIIVKTPIMGKNGRVFNMYLFRLDKNTSETPDAYHGELPPGKLTPLGNLLYKTHIYKFSQLFNILRGDMSLVGPRPESLEWYRKHQHHFRFLHRRVTVRPGITGMAQFKYRYEESQKKLQERVRSDVFYGENITLSLDLRIIIRSLFLLFKNASV